MRSSKPAVTEEGDDHTMTLTMNSRPIVAAVAAVLGVLAVVVSLADGDASLVPFFVALSLAAGLVAVLATGPWEGWRRGLGLLVAGGWIAVGVAITALLGFYQMVCGCSRPPPPPEATYLGLTATVFHLAAMYIGGALIVFAVLAPRQDPPGSSE